MSTGTGPQCNSITPYEPKTQAVQTATITAAVQTNDVGTDIAAQLNNYYQAHGLHGNLIHIAPHTSSVPPTQSLACSTSNPTITASIPFLNAFDCRHMQSQTMPNADVTISTMSCLTPISETYSQSEENLDSSGVSTLPEGLFSFISQKFLSSIHFWRIPCSLKICDFIFRFSSRCHDSNRYTDNERRRQYKWCRRFGLFIQYYCQF